MTKEQTTKQVSATGVSKTASETSPIKGYLPPDIALREWIKESIDRLPNWAVQEVAQAIRNIKTSGAR